MNENYEKETCKMLVEQFLVENNKLQPKTMWQVHFIWWWIVMLFYMFNFKYHANKVCLFILKYICGLALMAVSKTKVFDYEVYFKMNTW